MLPIAFRAALFAAAASLAAYIPYKYATQLHAIEGLYAFVFPFSALLAAAGMVLALRPRSACSCSMATRAGFAVLAGLWLATGLLCVPSLLESVARTPAPGLFASLHMLAQHVFLSLAVLAFAVAPQAMARACGVPAAIGPLRAAETP
jgi:hypothetical protein